MCFKKMSIMAWKHVIVDKEASRMDVGYLALKMLCT